MRDRLSLASILCPGFASSRASLVASTLAAFAFACVPGCESGLIAPTTDSVALSGGTFVMGSALDCNDVAGVSCKGDRPPHFVKVSPLSMQVFEVSNIQYATCVQNSMCPFQEPFDPKRKSQPALVDSPDAARAYCASVGMRLPTEAEFEYAARVDSRQKEHLYPWGDDAPVCSRLALAGCNQPLLADVGAAPGDVTDTGLHDLAGNAPEWVEDSYEAHAGCLDRLGYAGDLCAGQPASCAEQRCAADMKSCARGCIAPSLSEGASMSMPGPTETVTPSCPLPSDGAEPLIDPLVRAATPDAVVRGGSATDGACAFAGFTRRHAVPHRYKAGFRCVQSGDAATQRKPLTSYRFTLTGCQPDQPVVKLSIGTNTDPNAVYNLDVFPPIGAPMLNVAAQSGVVDNLPCNAVFVVHPQAARPLVVEARSTSMQGCKRGLGMPDLSGGGDVPATGVVTIPLMGNCM